MKPRIFIGSSSEALPLARYVAGSLKPQYVPIVWDKDVFVPGKYAVDSLLSEVQKCHLAVFVFSQDDVVKFRGRSYNAARDNVIFELGLFMAKIGRQGCFFLSPRTKRPFRIPTDLTGLTYISYDATAVKKNFKSGLNSPVTELKEALDDILNGDGHRLSLTGKWTQSWTVKSNSFRSMNKSPAEVLHIGEKLYARTEAEGRVYMVDATFESSGFVTGRWYDKEHGPTYFGAFQLRIDPKGHRMSGKWIGFSATKPEINTDKWIWERKK